MPEKDICGIIESYLEYFDDKKTYQKMKKIILDNYSKNSLASTLLSGMYSVNKNQKLKLFKQDADILYATSSNYKVYILDYYSKYVKKEMLSGLIAMREKFSATPNNINKVYYDGFGDILEQYIEKYMDLSNSKDFKYLAKGSTAACYKVGDYVIKLIDMKYSKEQIICPRLFLILRNIEEQYLRLDNAVVGGIEVQKYLKKDASNLGSDIIRNFIDELYNLGYSYRDVLVDGQYGSNVRYLDSYKEADIINPELLPKWFKQNPVVLIDHDLVYKNGNSKSRVFIRRKGDLS